ncbi:hypothetical protein DCS_00352 [Drechmeria coniospora]|uniref:Uncharacterized protein n=1 Tax=Drechmeria coniospora TaxID=98403 RepID=A0A151GQF0_DRECN|nr:hypothetical protein DCS_00352 [Drechmeria coniospora]KYK59222.1 hypothetical protein DCS_00352 [Drechmeria coniospora]
MRCSLRPLPPDAACGLRWTPVPPPHRAPSVGPYCSCAVASSSGCAEPAPRWDRSRGTSRNSPPLPSPGNPSRSSPAGEPLRSRREGRPARFPARRGGRLSARRCRCEQSSGHAQPTKYQAAAAAELVPAQPRYQAWSRKLFAGARVATYGGAAMLVPPPQGQGAVTWAGRRDLGKTPSQHAQHKHGVRCVRADEPAPAHVPRTPGNHGMRTRRTYFALRSPDLAS